MAARHTPRTRTPLPPSPTADKAPATKLVLGVCGLLSLVVSAPRLSVSLSLDGAAQLLERGQWWRLASSLWPASSVAGGLVTAFLLYRFRTFERQMGSSRFSALLLLVTAWAAGTRAGLVLSGAAPHGLASGPLELLGALFVYYFRESCVR